MLMSCDIDSHNTKGISRIQSQQQAKCDERELSAYISQVKADIAGWQKVNAVSIRTGIQ